MNSLVIAALCFVGYFVAYYTYGKFLSKKIFKIDEALECPSCSLRDDKDYVPTKKEVLFGHHFTSIAGLGPIVGPAIAIIWGWVPAVIWVFFGAVFMGAVHDFGSLMVSMRNQGRSVGDVASKLISHRVRTLFLLIIFFELLIVIAVFALIIGILFNMYPASVIPVWGEVPIAVLLGYLVYKKGQGHTMWGIVALVIMYVTVVIGAYVPLTMPSIAGLNPIVVWVLIMLAYAYIASVLPVTTLLQPRDYINGHQLLVALTLLGLGAVVAHPTFVAPTVNMSPEGAPPILPFLFVVIACGAISGFHSLVSSGTSAKQCESEKDCLFIGYGSMLTESALSTLVIVAVGAGIGLGMTQSDGSILTGTQAFTTHYASWSSAAGLGAKLGAFVEGSANLMASYGIPKNISLAIMGVFLVSFAATTLDSATRIQRYVVGELAQAYKMPALAKPNAATFIAVGTAAVLCFNGGFGIAEVKKGALALWPLFGTVNQLMAAMALLVITVYLARRKAPAYITGIPLVFMIAMTGWAMVYNLQNFMTKGNMMLFVIGLIVLLLEVWMIFETLVVMKKVASGEAEPVEDCA
ncbi:carbon starvation protein A [Pseudodesulfovibrio senegalensis]|uniref:Carbon starvation protein A n=1 Tax=Pseudodesulfovibrio senegalensis TaxID=1721087 RepID=A0A6N6N0Y9_9BACT|nr:carbon starvation protein A [Pseudodesulfovibrio senegalensis]KAB1440913.1 carbon starvation protein A [Pseudodesulfovibrio senegalensis]